MNDRIIGVFGLPGQGKTTFLAKLATDSLNGKSFLDLPPHDRVYSTFACPGCFELDPSMIGVLDFSNSLLLIDEASQFFDAREWKSFPPHVRTFFQIARHEHTSIVVCSQSYVDCDLRIRNLCYAFYLLENFPFLPHVSVIKPILHTMDVKNHQIVEGYVLAPPISWKFVFRKKYYALFDSFCSFVKYKPNNAPLYPGVNHLIKPKKKAFSFADLLPTRSRQKISKKPVIDLKK